MFDSATANCALNFFVGVIVLSGYEKNNDRDAFWDIERLVPKRSSSLSPFATKETVTTYESPAPRVNMTEPPQRTDADRALNLGAGESESESYTPSGMGLIKRVTIKKFIDKYDFYDSFRRSALLYFDYKTARCDFAQFYSYMPQYSQLTPSQKNYYFYWRDEVRHGRYPRSDYSYIYLYVYEILNLPDKIPADEGIKLLCAIWREYRRALPRLDNYLSIWVEDYCLVHRLPPPINELSGVLFECIGRAKLKEFYLADINEVGFGAIEPLLAYLSDYDWRSGRFSSGGGKETSALVAGEGYKRHMERAMYLLLHNVWNSISTSGNIKPTRVARDAFPNSLCTHSVKCKLEIEYISLADADEVRRGVTAAVRYTENKLRALLGVKSRLAVKDLPDEYKLILDRYFDQYFKEEQRRLKEAGRPSYEKLYEAPKGELSFSGADEIERASWTTTARLVEFSEGRDDEGVKPQIEEKSLELTHSDASGAEKEDNSPAPISREEMAFLEACLSSDRGFSGTTPRETLAEGINELFLDIIGDIVLEEMDGAFCVIEDYREDVEEWLKKYR